MTSNEGGQSSSFGRQQHQFDQTPLPPLGGATITRSMSRKSLSTHHAGALQHKQQQSTITKSATLSNPTARHSLSSARRVSSLHSSVTLDGRQSTDNSIKKRQIKPIGSATSSSNSGMGVRRGPAVVRSVSSMARHEKRVERRSLSPAKLSPAKLSQPSLSTSHRAGVSDPFSIEFRYPTAVAAGGERKKRSIGDVEELDEKVVAGGGMRRTKSIKGVLSERSGESPAKRLQVADDEPLDKKALVDKLPTVRLPASPARNRVRSRTRTQSDENSISRPKAPSFDNYLAGPSNRATVMDLESQIVLSSPSTNSTEASRKESRGMNNSSDDELDFISPRKKRAIESAAEDSRDGGGIRSPIRSPMQRKRITSPIRSPVKTIAGESVPMSRLPLSTSTVPASPLFAAPAAHIPTPPLHFVTESSVPSTSALPSKYSRASLPLASSLPSALATSQPMKRSGIPRPTTTASFPAIYNPHQPSSSAHPPARALPRSTAPVSSNNPPRRISNAALSSRYARSRDPNGDESMVSNSTLLFESTSARVGAVQEEEETGNVSVADETAARLANLQAMLSRLSMPRQSLAGVAVAGGTNFVPEKRGVTAVPSTTSHLERQRERRRTTMTGQFREEYTMPLSGSTGGESSMGPPKVIPSRAGARVAGRASLSGPPPSTALGSVRPSVPSSLSRSTSTFADQQVFRRSVPAPAQRSAVASGSTQQPPAASTASHIRAPRKSTLLPSSSSTAVLSDLLDDNHGKENVALPPRTAGSATGGDTTMLDGRVAAPKHTFLKDVVAFVDVRTLEGDDAGMIFVDMLKGMSARVRLSSFLLFPSSSRATPS